MRILGLITEYNPFHNGHLYHLYASKELTGATHTVAVMSGNFLQRGEPAIVDKWQRAKMAIRCGVDLVIELPTLYACSTAEFFAFGAIGLLSGLNIVDYICFGSEAGNLDLLKNIAHILVRPPSEFKAMLQGYTREGFTFPIARSRAIIEYFKKIKSYGQDDLRVVSNIMESPNNILGIEYLKALEYVNSPIAPYTINRKSAHYHSKEIANNCIASATAIRNHILSHGSLSSIEHTMPKSTVDILRSNINMGTAPIDSSHFEQAVFSILRRSDLTSIRDTFDVVEGLENRIYRCSIETNTLTELYDCIKSKRYTLTRLQRILMHTLLNINKRDLLYCNSKGGPQYARILAFNTRGREILKTLKTSSSIPIISNLKYYKPQNKAAEKMLDIDIRATNIYSLAFGDKSAIKAPLDYTMSPVYQPSQLSE